jgi:hypothetical protein
LTPVTSVRQQDRLVALLIRLVQRATRSGSQPGISWSSSSTTVTFAPSASYTVAISRPMIPPPITSIRFGIVRELQRAGRVDHARVVGDERQRHRLRAGGDDAVVEGDRPVADRERVGPVKRRLAVDTSTLRCLASPSQAAGQPIDDDSFQASSAPRSIFGLHRSDPVLAISSASAITRAACSSALEGMQPTFRQTPPSVS